MKKTLLASAALLGLATAAQAQELNIFVWAESIDASLIEAFEEETGISVTVDGYSSNEDLLTALQAGATAMTWSCPRSTSSRS